MTNYFAFNFWVLKVYNPSRLAVSSVTCLSLMPASHAAATLCRYPRIVVLLVVSIVLMGTVYKSCASFHFYLVCFSLNLDFPSFISLSRKPHSRMKLTLYKGHVDRRNSHPNPINVLKGTPGSWRSISI